MEWLKSKESNFEIDPSWDLEASGGVQKGGCAGPWSGECNNRASVFWILCMRDRFLLEMPKQTGVGIVQPGRDKSAGDEIGSAFTKEWSDVAKGAKCDRNMI